MYNLSKTYWLIYGVICSAVLLSMLVLGFKDRASLEYLLVTGGIIESLPALIYLATTVLSTFVATRARRFIPWGLYGVFCFFLAGEESKWGKESVLGWNIFEPSDQPGDLHNLLARAIAETIPNFVIACTVVLVIVLLAISYLVFGIPALKHVISENWLKRFRQANTSQQFVVTGIVLIGFGLVDMLNESLGLPYIPGQWSLEESCELLGSIALLFAAIVKVLEPSINKVFRRKS